MSDLRENWRMLCKDIDLVYSPDDGGWYLHHFDTDRTSITYETEKDAMQAYTENRIKWEANQ